VSAQQPHLGDPIVQLGLRISLVMQQWLRDQIARLPAPVRTGSFYSGARSVRRLAARTAAAISMTPARIVGSGIWA
jgi:hypothetical protein